MEPIIKKLQLILSFFFRITSTVVFTSAVYITVFWGPNSELDVRLLWQILISSFICALGCLLVSDDRESGEELSKREMQIRTILLYVYINVVILVCGFLCEWFYLSDWKMIVGMEVCIACTFLIVSVLTYLSDYKTAERMNQKLQERKRH